MSEDLKAWAEEQLPERESLERLSGMARQIEAASAPKVSAKRLREIVALCDENKRLREAVGWLKAAQQDKDWLIVDAVMNVLDKAECANADH